MSSDNDEFSDDSTTDSPRGWSLNAAMAQASRGANAYLPACGPVATLMLALLPMPAVACGIAGAATSANTAPEKPTNNVRGIFTGCCRPG